MCGIVGVIAPFQMTFNFSYWAALEAYRALLSLQHRGQDAAGILSFSPKSKQFFWEKNNGLVAQVFNEEKIKTLKGHMAIGHTRYETIGNQEKINLQPMFTGLPQGIGMAHNGNILNYHLIAAELANTYHQQLLSNNDIEIILNLWCTYWIEDKEDNEGETNPFAFSLPRAIRVVTKIMEKLIGAYSVVGLVAGHGMFGFRDPDGIRPLVLGEKVLSVASSGTEIKAYSLASETTALSFNGYTFVRDIAPGEFIFINHAGHVQSAQIAKKSQSSPCMFEWVYFSGAKAQFEQQMVYDVRFRLGQILGRKIKKLIADRIITPNVVVAVPDTSKTAAVAMAEELRLPCREGLLKNRYSQRSFILNSQEKRENMLELKLSPIPSEIRGKNILLVDDSIVRGTTSLRIMELLRKYGAKEIYFAITCPPIRFPCFYGIDFPRASDLVAHNRTPEEVAAQIHADQVIYLEEEELLEAVRLPNVCRACLNNCYPTSISSAKEFTDHRVCGK